MATIPDGGALLTTRTILRIERERSFGRAPVGERAIRDAISAGNLPAVRPGNADLVRWADYIAWRDSLPSAPRREQPETKQRVALSVNAAVERQVKRERAQTAAGCERGSAAADPEVA